MHGVTSIIETDEHNQKWLFSVCTLLCFACYKTKRLLYLSNSELLRFGINNGTLLIWTHYSVLKNKTISGIPLVRCIHKFCLCEQKCCIPFPISISLERSEFWMWLQTDRQTEICLFYNEEDTYPSKLIII